FGLSQPPRPAPLSHSPADLLELAPCPTRRSSDLGARPDRKHSRAARPSFRVGRWRPAVTQVLDGWPPPGLIAPGDRIRRIGRLIDRKSTRLNSSHVSISSAVFCLQKQTP